MNKPSLAHQFFSDIKSAADPASFLRGLTTSSPPTFETEWLDFKGEPRNDKDLKEIWYTAVAGFANTQGGVLVWGIDARKDANGVDAARDVTHVSDPSAFKSRLIELHRQATNPPVLGVEIEEVPDPAAAGKGFVVCLVPEGRFKPYRAEIKGSPQYYIRAGDNFVVPAPSLLRSLFYPRLNAVLWVEVDLSYRIGQGESAWDVASFLCDAHIHNSGTATAREAYVIVQVEPDLGKFEYTAKPNGTARANPRGGVALAANKPLHPGSGFRLSRMRWVLPTVPGSTHLVVPRPTTFKLRFLMHADNLEPQVASVEFITTDMEEGKAVVKKGTPGVGDWHLHIP